MKLRVPYWATEDFSIRLNGKEIAENYQPCSYVEIPFRQWSAEDSVEIRMPFGLHFDFGPDKMRLAATDKNQTQTAFAPRWAGTLMLGPLVMAAQATNWEEATLNIDQPLAQLFLPLDPDTVTLPLAYTSADPWAEEPGPRQFNAPKTELRPRTDDNLKLLTYSGLTFYPDYFPDTNLTHYFRLNLPGQEALNDVQTADEETATQALFEQVQMAKSRRDAQEAWEAMDVKVPEFAPWAPYGFRRMTIAYEAARQLLADPSLNSDAEQVAQQTAELEATLNAMRPGSLAELEDLDELLPLLEQVKASAAASTDEGKAAIDHADMVVKYVSDGSGTIDMIRKAVTQLQAVQ